MFSPQVLQPIARIIAVLLLIKAAFVVVMFAWEMVGEAPIIVFDPSYTATQQYFLLFQELGTAAFLYFFLGALSTIIAHKAPQKAPARAATRSSSRRTTRHSKRKK